MPTIDTIPRMVYTATAGQTIFPYPWPIAEAEELRVWASGVLLTLDVGYTVTGVGSPTGGNVVLTTGALAGTILVLLRHVPLSQDVDYADHTPFPAAAHEGALDKLTRITQQIQEEINRTVRQTPSTLMGPVTLPDPASLTTIHGGKKALVYNDAGTDLRLLELVTETGLVGDRVPALAFSALPPAETAGRQRQVTSGAPAGLYHDTGISWVGPTVYDPANKAGVDLSAKIAAVLADMTTSGGTIDTRSFTGTQISNAPILINKPCVLLLGSVRLQCAVSPMLSVINPAAEVIIEGIGRRASVLANTLSAQVAVDVQSQSPVTFKKLTIDHTGPATAGAGIRLNGFGGTVNGYSRFEDIELINQWVGLDTVSAASWNMYACFVVDNRHAGIVVDNQVDADNGDSSISDCFIVSGIAGASYGIFQRASGGLRVVDNKFLGHQYAYYMDIAPGAFTGDLLIQNNSMEAQTGGTIRLDRTSGTGTFTQILIQNNQIAAVGQPEDAIVIASAAYSNVRISENIIGIISPHTCVAILSGVSSVAITDNTFNANGGSSVGVTVFAGAFLVDIGPNNYFTVGTPYNLSLTTPAISFAAPFLTTAQRDAGGSPVGQRTIIFNATTGKFQGWTGAAWVDFH